MPRGERTELTSQQTMNRSDPHQEPGCAVWNGAKGVARDRRLEADNRSGMSRWVARRCGHVAGLAGGHCWTAPPCDSEVAPAGWWRADRCVGGRLARRRAAVRGARSRAASLRVPSHHRLYGQRRPGRHPKRRARGPAPRRVRGVLLGDPTEGPCDDEVHVVADIPHAWLLPRTAAVVHHGGPAPPAPGCAPACPTWSARWLPTSRCGPSGCTRWAPAPGPARPAPQRPGAGRRHRPGRRRSCHARAGRRDRPPDPGRARRGARRRPDRTLAGCAAHPMKAGLSAASRHLWRRGGAAPPCHRAAAPVPASRER